MSEQLVRVFASSKGRPSECRSCHRPIVFYRTYPGGKAMPFDGDPIPSKRENLPIALATDGSTEMIEILSIPAALNHFATCPQSKSWSRKKPAASGPAGR